MVFTSPRFLLFLSVVLLLLALVNSRDSKKHLLALGSSFFYAAWDWRYLGLLLFISVVDYIAANQISRSSRPSPRKCWLLLSIISNLGVLCYFKYCDFFIQNTNYLLGSFGVKLPLLNILLPVGISFYTFKTMSYTIDVYRGDMRPCRSWLDYATFITFFPELIAGPIVRASVFLPQMSRQIGPTHQRLVTGGSMFLLGLIKKSMIADRMALVADPIFADPRIFSSVTIWMGVLAYAIQIYCDFSGYSDMAIGCAKIIGYDLPENFNMPYLSQSVTEFWKRWHMTLSSWLKDYLYIPLGDSRHGQLNTYRNLMLTMLLGGLWHGASWNFVLWGGLHGAGLALHRIWSSARGNREALPALIAGPMTFLFVIVTWVPFRSKSLGDSVFILKKMVFISATPGGQWLPESLFWCVALVIIGHGLGYCIGQLRTQPKSLPSFRALLATFGLKIEEVPLSGTYVIPSEVTTPGVYLIAMACLMIFLFAPMNTNPFIYFQF